MSIFVVARLTFREAARRKILLAAFLFGLVFLAVFGVGYHFIIQGIGAGISGTRILEIAEISNFLMMAGLYVVNFLTVMMTVLTSVDTISGEIASGTIQTVVAKPIRRREVILGKWMGFAIMLTLYLLLMAGGVVGTIYLQSGYSAPHLLRGLGLMWLNAMLLLSVSLFGGAVLSTLANGVMVFGLYGIAFIGGWIEQIGTFLPNPSASQTAVNIGIITSLVMPGEALWRRAAYELQSPLVLAMGFSPFASASVPSPAMIGYALLFTAGALALAILLFQKRDL